MAATTTNPIELSKARLADLQDTVASTLHSISRAATRRASIAAGTIKNAGLGLAYSTAASAADGAATVTRTLPIVKLLAEPLEKRASALTELETSLDRPAIEKYDDLNVRQVADALEELGAWELLRVRRYEVGHKNRKTVLGAVDRLMR